MPSNRPRRKFPSEVGASSCILVGDMATAIAPTQKRHSAPWSTYVPCSIAVGLYALWRTLGASSGNLHVLGSFWESGNAFAKGLNPYAVYPLVFRLPYFRGVPAGTHDLNLNPPAILPLFALISRFPPVAAAQVWTLVSVACLLFAAAMLVGDGTQKRQIAWLLLCPAALDTIFLGQDTLFLLLIATTAWRLLKADRQWAAGLLIGILIAVKPNFGLWPVLLLFSNFRRAGSMALAVCAFLCTLPMMLFGPAVYLDWFRAIPNDFHWIFPTNLSLIALAHFLGHAWIGQLAAIGLIVAAVAFTIRKRPSLEPVTGIAFTLAILSSPVGWLHYSLLLAPVLLAFRWSGRLTAVLALTLFPIQLSMVAMGHSDLASLTSRFIYILPIAVLFVYFMAANRSRPEIQTAR